MCVNVLLGTANCYWNLELLVCCWNWSQVSDWNVLLGTVKDWMMDICWCAVGDYQLWEEISWHPAGNWSRVSDWNVLVCCCELSRVSELVSWPRVSVWNLLVCYCGLVKSEPLRCVGDLLGTGPRVRADMLTFCWGLIKIEWLQCVGVLLWSGQEYIYQISMPFSYGLAKSEWLKSVGVLGNWSGVSNWDVLLRIGQEWVIECPVGDWSCKSE